MYEPIRTKSVHTMAAAPEIPHRSREQELDIRLAGQLTALLTVTDELHALATRTDGGAPQDAGRPAPGWTAPSWPPPPSASPIRSPG